MEKQIRASQEMELVYDKISKNKKKFGTFHKCIFHMHSPASYDFRLLNKYSEKDFQNCKEDEVFKLCIENYVFPENEFTLQYFNNKDVFGIFENAKECLSYLLLAKRIIDSKIEMVVLTDHNTIQGYDKLCFAISNIRTVRKMTKYPEVILGVELSCADKNHVVGIFENIREAKNKFQHWLEEYILSDKDGTFLTSFEVIQQINKIGGISYIAHIDTSNTFNVKYLSHAYKKKLFELDCLDVIGISDYCKMNRVESNLLKYVEKDFCFVVDEDAHTIDDIGTKCVWIKGSKINFNMIKDAIRDHAIAVNYQEPKENDKYIKGVYVKNKGKNFLSGKDDKDFCLSFSDSMNCIIGGRGTGKSSILQMLDFVIRQHFNDKESLEFICRHEEIWLLFVCQNEEFMIHFFAPIKEYEDDSILKYFARNNKERYGSKFTHSNYDIEQYALNNYIGIDKVVIKDDLLYAERVLRKREYLEKFFHAKYSVNDLVRTASGEELNLFIYNTLFQNAIFENVPKLDMSQKKLSLDKTVLYLDQKLEMRRHEVLKIINEFNENQKGLFRIVYNQAGKVDEFDFEKLFKKIYPNVKYYKAQNIEVDAVVAYLYRLQRKIGILKLLVLATSGEYEEINKIIPISGMLADMSKKMIEKDIKEVKIQNQVDLIEQIISDFINIANKPDILDYLENYITKVEAFELEFNLNSKETNKSIVPIYKNVRVLSLGQKVVAMLSFLLGYSEYSNDFTPFIIDQPEDNLDNQYIYKNLVKQLRYIKSKRQVIIATHNATIVTNAKAEQVVVMDSDNEKGWIEATGYPNEKKIKKHIINYLEGGIDSFKHKSFIYDEVLKN